MSRRFTAMANGRTAEEGDVEVVTWGPGDVYDVYEVGGNGAALGALLGHVHKDTEFPTSREWVLQSLVRGEVSNHSTLHGALHFLAQHRLSQRLRSGSEEAMSIHINDDGCTFTYEQPHAGHDPQHMSGDTCDHGRLLWQSCHQDGCDATACGEQPAPGHPAWSLQPGNAEKIIAARAEYPGKADVWIARALEQGEELEAPSAEQERSWDEQYDGRSLGS